MQRDIDKLQAQQAKNQDIYTTLMKTTKAEILERVKEVDGQRGQHQQAVSKKAKDSLWLKAKGFEYRLSDPCKPTEHTYFPTIEKLNYENYLMAVNVIDYNEFKFTLRNGAHCGDETDSEDDWTCHQLN